MELNELRLWLSEHIQFYEEKYLIIGVALFGTTGVICRKTDLNCPPKPPPFKRCVHAKLKHSCNN